MRDEPLVSILIVNWDGKEVFAECLLSLQKLNYPNWELIVIDNGSKDDSRDLAKKYKLSNKRYILIQNSTNLGFARANNQGLEKAEGKYVLLLNNDTKVNPEFLKIMVEKMENDPTIGAMQPKIFLTDRDRLLDNAGSYLTTSGFLQHWGFMQNDGKEFNEEKEIFSAKGACLLTIKDLADRIGLFDEDFISYFEESDFCWRVWLSGYRVIYYPKTFIYHKLGATSKKTDQVFINFHSFKNRILSLFKNLNFLNLIRILIPHLVIVAMLGFYYLLKFEFKKAKMIFDSLMWNFLNFSKAINKRRFVQQIRVKSDSELFKRVYKPMNLKDMFIHFKKVEANFK